MPIPRSPGRRTCHSDAPGVCHPMSGRIIEGIVSTQDTSGKPHLAPMGITEGYENSFQLKPFHSSRTYENLRCHPAGVFHLVDDAELLARATIHDWGEGEPRIRAAAGAKGFVLEDACQWRAFVVREWDVGPDRSTLGCEVLATGQGRPFRGWNRATHAVLELAILATRVHLLPRETLEREMERFSVWITKTGGESEHRAWRLLQDHLARTWAASVDSGP